MPNKNQQSDFANCQAFCTKMPASSLRSCGRRYVFRDRKWE